MPDLETRIGYLDVKRSPVHFYVQKNGGFIQENSVITFDFQRLNVGSSMNINTGVFTASRSGTYFFSFAFMADEPNKPIVIFFRKNGEQVGAAQVFTNSNAFSKMIFQSSMPAIFKLKAGDWVDLYKKNVGNIYDDANHYTHFTGWLMEEDLDFPN